MKVITLSREPLAWYLSNLSQNYEEYQDDIACVVNRLKLTVPERMPECLVMKMSSFIKELVRSFDKNVQTIDENTVSRLAQCADTSDPEEKRVLASVRRTRIGRCSVRRIGGQSARAGSLAECRFRRTSRDLWRLRSGHRVAGTGKRSAGCFLIKSGPLGPAEGSDKNGKAQR